MFRHRAWGIDLGRSAVKGALVAASGDGVEVLEADIVPLEGPAPESGQDPTRDARLWRALAEFQKRHALHRCTTCVAIPAQNTLVRELTVAAVEGRKVEEMVRYEAANEMPFVLDEVAWDYVLFDQQPGQVTRQGLLLAVKRNVIETCAAVFAQLGIGQVDRITVAPLALLNFLRLELDGDARILALDVGAENSDMLVLAGDRFWMRSMVSGGNHVTALLQGEFDLSFEAAERAKAQIARSRYKRQIAGAIRPAMHELVRHVKANLGYLERTSDAGPFDAAYLLGGGGRLVGLDRSLRTALRQDVRGLAELKHVVVSPRADAAFIRANMDRLAVALGAALCGLPGRDATGVSFRPSSRMRLARIGRARGLMLGVGLLLWAILLTLYGLGLYAAKSVEQPLGRYRELASIAHGNQRQLDKALDRDAVRAGLERMVAAARGRSQPLAILSETVEAFRAAGRASRYRFRITQFDCADPDAAQAAAPPPKKRTRRMPAQAAGPEPESAPPEEPGPGLLKGQVTGLISVPRGGGAAEAYRRFSQDLLGRLRASPSLAKARPPVRVAKGARLVALERGSWPPSVRPGDLLGPLSDGRWYVIDAVPSGAKLMLAEPFAGEDFQGTCTIVQVAPVRFNEQALEFVVRFEVPKEPGASLAELLGEPTE